MFYQPKFKTCFQIEIIESVGVFLLSESDYFVLTGHLYELVAPLIDGRHSVDEIVELLRGQVSAAEVYYALTLMERKGYIMENDNSLPSQYWSVEDFCFVPKKAEEQDWLGERGLQISLPRPELSSSAVSTNNFLLTEQYCLPSGVAAFWDSLNVERTNAASRLKSTTVSVTSFGAVPSQQFIATLESLNIQVVAEEGDIVVVLTDDYLQAGLDEFNQKALQSRRPWMLVKPVGKKIWIGPIFDPDRTGCWECLAQRLRANRPVEAFIQNHKDISTLLPTSLAALPSTLQTGLNMAATEITKWILQGENKKLEGNLVTFDAMSLETENHILVKRPQCPACGEPEYWSHREPLPVRLESQQKTFTADGGHRFVSPEKTLKQYERHISPITGAVRGLIAAKSVSNGDLTPIYVAGHNFATMFDSLYFLRQNLRGKSAGKGKTDIQAKASALCEALERYSGIFQGYEIRQKGTYKAMGEAAIHPNTCMGFSEAQYQTRAQWNASCSNFFQKVPEPFDPEQEIEWTPVWSLTHNQFKYLPTAYCYYGYPKPPKTYCWADSNGSAAGNTKEEAILQGFMELVERDSVALWWYNRLKRPAVDLGSFGEPYFQALKDYYQSINRELWVLDITSDLNIPTFAAISRRSDRRRSAFSDRDVEDIIYGFGAHFDPKIAILRALTEANQVLPAVSSVAPDGTTQYGGSDRLALEWWQAATLQNQPYLLPDESAAPKTYADYPQQGSDDLREDVMTCVDIAARHGLETLVLDQTRPDIGLNVVKVIVPGLRHFWKRWAPGRLYEIPVKLGWLPEPLKENQLNPWPIFF